MSATVAICQFTTKPVRKLADLHHRHCTNKFLWILGRFLRPHSFAGIRANFRIRGHLPVCHQICVGSGQISATAVICLCAAKWADFHDRGYLPVCYQDFLGSGQIFTTAAICHYATKFVWSLKKSPQLQPYGQISVTAAYFTTKLVWDPSRFPQLQLFGCI